jgi:hypothetical protein
MLFLYDIYIVERLYSGTDLHQALAKGHCFYLLRGEKYAVRCVEVWTTIRKCKSRN